MSKRDWKKRLGSMPVVFATMDRIREVANSKSMVALVWPDEGIFAEDRGWTFNEAHAPDFEPLILDIQTANMLCTIHAMLAPENRAKAEDWVSRGRGHFGTIVNFGWDAIERARKGAA